MTLSLRVAARSDLETIVRIYNSTVPLRTVTADTIPVTLEQRTAWFDNHTGNRPIWMIEDDGKPAGWMSVTPFSDRPAYDSTAEVSIYLDEKVRGRGIGQYAIDALKSQMETLGIETILALIFAHNAPSMHLFQKNEFQIYGEMPEIAVMDGQRYSLKILGYQKLRRESHEH